MRSLPAPRLGAALLLAATTWSCAQGRGPSTVPTPYQDPVTDHSLVHSSRLAVERGQKLCAEQTHFAVELRRGETLSARLQAGDAAVLVVSACTPDVQAARDGTALEIVEEIDGRTVARHQLPLDRTGWWSEEIPATASGPEQVVFKVRTSPRRGPPVYLRDLHLRTRTAKPDALPDVPRILLVSVDTLRADTIAALGGEWSTPNLDRLVRESQAWIRHRAADSWTKPSHAGLLTGFHPAHTRDTGNDRTKLRQLAALSDNP